MENDMKMPGAVRKRRGRCFLLVCMLVNVAVILLVPLRFKGFVIGFSIEIWALCALGSLLGRKFKNNLVAAYVLAAIAFGAESWWRKATLDGYVERLGTAIIQGEGRSEALESPPFVARVFCFGRIGWLREEVELMGRTWDQVVAAASQGEDAVCDRAVQTFCRRCEEGRSFDISHYIVQRIAERLRSTGLAWSMTCSECAKLRRGKLISALRASDDAIDITTFSNSAEYIEALFAQNGDVDPEDVERAKREWSFAVDVPDDAPDSFPVMIPSAFDLSALPMTWEGGTNGSAYAYFAAEGDGSILAGKEFPFVTRSGEIRQVRCGSCVHSRCGVQYDYCVKLWKILGEKPYCFANGVRYLTPTGVRDVAADGRCAD